VKLLDWVDKIESRAAEARPTQYPLSEPDQIPSATDSWQVWPGRVATLTGIPNFEFPMGGKWVEFLKEMAPHLSHVALIFNPETAPYAHSGSV
jgi:hypothetical protein